MDQSERLGDMVAAARSAAFEQRADMWTALPAIIEKYDEKKIITSAQPTIKGRWRDPQGKWHWVQLPLCLDCPVQFPSGGGYTLTFPITKGDEGILIFSSRCIDKWWKDGGVQQQAVLRMHDLSDGMFIPGIRSQARKLDPVPSTNSVVLRSDDNKRLISITSDSILQQVEDAVIKFTKDELEITVPKVTVNVTKKFQSVGKTYLGLTKKDKDIDSLVTTNAGDAGQTWADIEKASSSGAGGIVDSGGNDPGDTTTTLSAKSNSLASSTSSLGGGLGGLASGLSSVAGGIGGLSGLAGNLSGLSGNLNGMLGGLNGLSTAFNNLGGALSSLGGLGGVLNGLNGGLGSITAGLGNLATGLAGLNAGGLNGLISGMGGMLGGIGGLSGGLTGILSSVTGLTGGLNSMVPSLLGMSNIATIVGNLSAISVNLNTLNIPGLIGSLGAMATTLAGVGGVSPTLASMSTIVVGLNNSQLGDIPPNLNATLTSLDALLSQLPGVAWAASATMSSTSTLNGKFS